MSLNAQDVRLGYRDRTVVETLSVSIARGRIVCLIGPNGCGKSTILHGLGRLLPAAGGVLTLDGRALPEWRGRSFAREVAILPQSPVVPEGLTVRELVGYGRHPHQTLLGTGDPGGARAVAEAIAHTHLEPLAERPVTELSGGERQRAWIALALAQQARILLLDEPTTFLDIRHQLELLEMLARLNRELGITLVMSLHDLGQAARYSDRLLMISAGAVVADGAPRAVLTEQTLAAVFGVRARMLWDGATGIPVCVPIAASPVAVATRNSA